MSRQEIEEGRLLEELAQAEEYSHRTTFDFPSSLVATQGASILGGWFGSIFASCQPRPQRIGIGGFEITGARHKGKEHLVCTTIHFVRSILALLIQLA